jgi:AraC-like DNA-binding protein
LKEKNVTEVAYDLGYENISHFISQSKKKYGYTPKQHQKINQKRTL